MDAEDHFVSFELDRFVAGEPLPVDIYIYIDFRFITFRGAGDTVDRATFDRLHLKKVRYLFVKQPDLRALTEWATNQAHELSPVSDDPEAAGVESARGEARRKMLDIFQEEHPDRRIGQAIDASRRIVDEIMKYPLTVKPLSQLQTYSQGTVDHSVNVSILAVYLAIQMGYAHQVILNHIALGALLHDVGKARVTIADNDDSVAIERKLRDHPTFGIELLDKQAKIPNEVKMIIAQHHENNDGSGFPKGLRGKNIYDLAKIVSIANVFDEMVGEASGSLVTRQREAIRALDEVHFKKFDPQKLEKSLKVLKMGV